MKQTISILVIFTFILAVTPAHAALDQGFEPMEKSLIDKQQQELELQKSMLKEDTGVVKKEKKSSWWKWTLGAVILGGIAVAATGSKDSSSSNNSSSGGTVNVGW